MVAAACLILGDAEAENKMVQIKWLKTGEQVEWPQVDLLDQPDQLRQQMAQNLETGSMLP